VKIGRPQRRSLLAAHQGEAAILFSVCGYVFAISASAVAEIQSLRGLKPLVSTRTSGHTGHAGKVKHLLEREFRTYFVVDANHYFHLPLSQSTRVLLLRDSCVALRVDAIERMTEIESLLPLPAAFGGEEREWYRGLALVGNRVVPAVNPASFLSRFEQELLKKEHGLAPAKSVEATGVLV